MIYKLAQKLLADDSVRVREHGVLVSAKVIFISHDHLCKVVYVSVVTDTGNRYYSIPHHRIEEATDGHG